LCENCQRQGCRAFIGLTIHAKNIGVGRPLLFEEKKSLMKNARRQCVRMKNDNLATVVASYG